VPTLALLTNLHWPEMLALLALGLLLFGRRLPEVGRSLGRGIVEFKRGLKGMADEIEEESSKPSSKPAEPKELPRNEGAQWPPQQPRAEDVRVSRSEKVDGGE
jgi:sec-independent protein translocase protein TatA